MGVAVPILLASFREVLKVAGCGCRHDDWKSDICSFDVLGSMQGVLLQLHAFPIHKDGREAIFLVLNAYGEGYMASVAQSNISTHLFFDFFAQVCDHMEARLSLLDKILAHVLVAALKTAVDSKGAAIHAKLSEAYGLQ